MLFLPMDKLIKMTPNEAGSFFPTNPDLADILVFYMCLHLRFLDFQALGSQIQGCQLWP